MQIICSQPYKQFRSFYFSLYIVEARLVSLNIVVSGQWSAINIKWEIKNGIRFLIFEFLISNPASCKVIGLCDAKFFHFGMQSIAGDF
jgi:hypothetical protein